MRSVAKGVVQMNTGQMLLVLGAMTLLSITMLSVNRVLVEQERASMEGAFQLVATSLGQGLIEEAIGKGFDEVVLSDHRRPCRTRLRRREVWGRRPARAIRASTI